MSLVSKFKELYGSAEKPAKGTERSITNPEIAAAVRDVEKRGFKKIGVYKTDSEQLYSAVNKAKNAGLSVSGVKIGGSTILFKKQKNGLTKDLFGATKVAAKGLGDWADRVAPDEPNRKTKAKTAARKPKRAVRRKRSS